MDTRRITAIWTLVLLAAHPGAACIEADADYQVKVASLNVDYGTLEYLCNEDICTHSESELVLRSTADPSIAVSFSDTALIEDAVLSFVAPYAVSEGTIVPGEGYRPEDIDWKTIISADLAFLREQGIAAITEDDVESIVSLVRDPGALVIRCGGSWSVVGQNCYCDDETGEVACERCTPEGPPKPPVLPTDPPQRGARTEHLREPVYDAEGKIVEQARPKASVTTTVPQQDGQSSLEGIPATSTPETRQPHSPVSLPEDDLNELLSYVLAGLLVVGLAVIFAGKR